MFGFGFSGSFDPVKDIPDLSGKVILVTGGKSSYISPAILMQKAHAEA